MLKRLFALSDKGAKDLKKGGLAATFSKGSLFIPMALFLMVLQEICKPLLGEEASTPNILLYVILSVLSIAIIFICNYIEYCCTYIAAYEESSLRRIKLAEKLRKLPLSYFGEHDLSEMTTSMMSDCNELERTFSGAIPKMIGSVFSIILIMIGLFVVDWRMSLALFCVFPVALLLILGSKKLQERMGTKRMNSRLAAADGIQEFLDNIADIKTCNQTEKYLGGLEKKLQDVLRDSVKVELTSGTLLTSAQMLLRVGFPLVVLTGAVLLVNDRTDLFTYMLFLLAASRVYEPLSGVMSQLTEIFNANLQIKRMKELENQPELSGSENCANKNYDISFNHVSFSYKDGENVLNDVSFTAKQGEVTAFVGPSGSGKSTAAKLAARFWDVNGGNILLGGVDIKTVDPEVLLKNFSIVFQDVVLFSDTIMENIRLGRRDATDEEVIAVAKAACCDEFVSRFPKGYDTVIGENGSTLSGGERQRISIARALLKDAPIILLDEATASLDVENETSVQNAITRLTKNKTVLVIAHRMRTVAGADKVIVLDKGKIVEEGTPQELAAKGGLYSHMVQLQNESFEWSLN